MQEIKSYVVNFRMVKTASLIIKNISLIGGLVGAGKTSLLQAMAAVLTGEIVSGNLVTKKTIKKLIHRGEREAMIEVENSDSKVTAIYPACTLSSEGKTPPKASGIAVGLDNLLKMKTKDRQEYFAEFLKSSPTMDQLSDAIGKILTSEQKTKLAQNIQGLGWDAVHLNMRDSGARKKGGWENITGENYGSKKAENWMPEGWTADLMKATVESLEKEIQAANEWVEAAIKDQAISQSEMERLTILADDEDNLAEIRHKLSDRSTELGGDLNRLELKSGGINVSKPYFCPNCDIPLGINKSGDIVAVNKNITKLEYEKQLKEQTKLEKDKLKIQKQLTDIRKKYDANETKFQAAQRAVKMLNKITSQSPESETADIDDVKNRLVIAQHRLKMFNQKSEAYEIHKSILKLASVVKFLAPDGLRLTVLNTALDEANNKIRELCVIADYPIISIDPDMDILYDGSSHLEASTGEQFRIKTVLQFFISQIEEPALIMVDVNVPLDSESNNGIINLAHYINIPVLIAMTIKNRESLPPIHSIDGGRVYWMDDGNLEKINGQAVNGQAVNGQE
ncbi:MAG TPA: hypothetical protein ENH82_13275 [bacterium]|nr:hypothetical protein [bacterium]